MLGINKKIGDSIEFDKKNYIFKGNLGAGACGTTILIYNQTLEQYFACKKQIKSEFFQEKLLSNFIREAKLMFNLFHNNIVRVFDFYLYKQQNTAFIIMEYIQGKNIYEYLLNNSEKINDIFIQVIDGFLYLERNNILHRDIRKENIMITDEGIVKIIDFGFGKQNKDIKDTFEQTQNKSFNEDIPLNFICSLPKELQENNEYNSQTEIYFIGGLFNFILKECNVENFKYHHILDKMQIFDNIKRIKSFQSIKDEINKKQIKISFTENEINVFKIFENYLINIISSIDAKHTYNKDLENISKLLNSIYHSECLHDIINNNASVARVLVTEGNLVYYAPNQTKQQLPVKSFKAFLDLWNTSPENKKKIMLLNIYSRLDQVKRYDVDDEIPF
ncbi:protein kinase [Rickettsiales bacterium LUAb2]